MRQEEWVSYAVAFLGDADRTIKRVLRTRGRPKYRPADTMDDLAVMIRRMNAGEVARYLTDEASTTSLNFLLRAIDHAKVTINNPDSITAKAMRLELQTKQTVSASYLAGALMAFRVHMDSKTYPQQRAPE